MDLRSNESIRAVLYLLSPDGDLVAVADDMRRMGVDSLLICTSGGRIARVVTEHRVRRLAQPEPHVLPGAAYIPQQVADFDPAPSPEGEGVSAQSG